MRMKALVVVLMALLLGVSFTGMVYAQAGAGGGQQGPNEVFQQKLGAAKTVHFEGTVLSHDVACHCIVIKTGKGNLTVQDDYAKFDQEYDRAKGLTIGQKASGSYKTIDYINYAIDIHQAKM